MFAGLAGGAIGFYKSKSEFQDLLKQYRTAADCANCVTRNKVDTMEREQEGTLKEIKEHTRSLLDLKGELKLSNQMQSVIMKKVEAIRKFQDELLPKMLEQLKQYRNSNRIE